MKLKIGFVPNFLVCLLWFCNPKQESYSQILPDLLIPIEEKIKVEFQYGEISELKSFDSNFFSYSKELNKLCFLSKPNFFYPLDSGFKFTVCRSVNKDETKDWNDLWDNDDFLFHYEFGDIQFEKIRKSEWENQKKALSTKEFWKEGRLHTGERTISSFALPDGELYRDSIGICHFAFPTVSLETINTLQILRFPCPSWNSDLVLSQNKKYLDSCVPGLPSLTESFRHSESKLGRYLEFQNETSLPLCPSRRELEFVSGDGKSNKATIEFPLLPPNGIVLFRINSGIAGDPLDEKLSLEIGKNGNWKLGEAVFYEKTFSFRHGSEFFSQSRNGDACAEQWNFYKTKEAFCGNPGLPNRIRESIATASPLPACDPSKIQLTEFYPGDDRGNPMFLEWKSNAETACDASDLEINFQGDSFPWSAKEDRWEPNQIVVLSAFSFEGWGFSSKVRGLSTRRIDFGYPDLAWKSRKKESTVSIFPAGLPIPIIKKLQGPSFSLLPDGKGNWFPYPSNTPGSASIFDKDSLDSLSISEIYLESGFDGIRTSPEDRFLEFQSPLNKEGFFTFKLTKRGKEESFISYKPLGDDFIVLSNRAKNCLPDGFFILPDGTLTAEDLEIQTSTESDWVYKHRFWGDFGRRSFHPERSPFFYSVHSSSHSSFEPRCRDFVFASPGFSSRKVNRVKSTLSGQRTVSTYHFVEPPTQGTHRVGNGENWTAFEGLTPPNVSDFAEGEVLFSEWNFSANKEFRIHRKGDLEITAFSRHPNESQNEWIRFCNRSGKSLSLQNLFIRDETSSDRIVPYAQRFPTTLPRMRQTHSMILNSLELQSERCAILVDPDGRDWRWPIEFYQNDLLLTIVSTSTLGNGLAIGESFSLVDQSTARPRVLATLGQISSNSFFRIEEKIGQVITLKSNTLGDEPSDYVLVSEGDFQ